ncbi:hypothetical protein HOY80DRAFT_1139598 [Tuber brumale]|nr:hypothetical protein HOY80DRAFT_1139598 [Tuber brumale]
MNSGHRITKSILWGWVTGLDKTIGDLRNEFTLQVAGLSKNIEGLRKDFAGVGKKIAITQRQMNLGFTMVTGLAHGLFTGQSCIDYQAMYPADEMKEHVLVARVLRCETCAGLVYQI